MPFQKDENEIGAIWIKQGQRGEFLSGTINGVKFVAFRNDRKGDNDKAPDYRILKSNRE